MVFDNDNLIYDLRVSIAIFLLDGNYYCFPHRSMQEYFAADMIRSVDTEPKNYIYKNLMSKRCGFDGFNFWTLCEEMDTVYFLSHFVLKNLREFEKLLLEPIAGKDEKATVFLNFLNHLGIVLNFIDGSLISISHKSSLYHTLARYVCKGKSFLGSFFEWGTLCREEREDLLSKNSSKNDRIRLNTLLPEVQEALLLTQLPDKLYEDYLTMKQKVEDIETSLNTRKQQEKNLIKLIKK